MIARAVVLSIVAVFVGGCARPNPSAAPGTSPATNSSQSLDATATAGSPIVNPSGWRLLTDFPANGASQVNAIVSTDKGFVAVGTEANYDTACSSDTYRGHVWTSADGLTWTAQSTDPFSQTDLTVAFLFNGDVYALGFTGSLDNTEPCASAGQPVGTSVWRSHDGGVTWEQLPQPVALRRTKVSQVISAGNKLLAVGSTVDTDGVEQGATWTSADAQSWLPAEIPPATTHVAIAASGANVIVGFGDDEDFPLAWVSRDSGAHWYEESVDVPGTTETDVTLTVQDVIATGGGFIAVGQGCCLDPAQIVPIVFASADGTQWHGTMLSTDKPLAMRRVVSLGDRLLAVGTQTAVDTEQQATDVGGRSWLSADGKAWTAGPSFDELADGDVNAIAAGSAGVVVAGVTYTDSAEPGAGSRLDVWYAPRSAFSGGASH